MIREIVASDIPALLIVRPQTRENAMSVDELASIGITHDSMKAAIKGSHRGWLFKSGDEVCGFAMGKLGECGSDRDGDAAFARRYRHWRKVVM